MYFYLNQNQNAVSLANVDANTTVLEWLRQNAWVGSKEGCASGDCGACTVVVVTLKMVANKPVLYFANINACIALMASLAGKWLITVEGLADENGLHAVQQAMVDYHGSQCGFCTPGFVMSLFALYHNHKVANKTSLHCIEQALSGNLCRCTGYQPIIEAAFAMLAAKKHSQDYYQKNQQAIIALLQAFQSEDIVIDNKEKKCRYDRPSSVKKLSQLRLDYPEAALIAGGTDLSLSLTQQLHFFNHVIDITAVESLKQISEKTQTLTFYAGVTLEQAWPLLVENYPTLNNYLNRFASKAIRHQATICGNIANASPIGDMPPVLLALAAKLNLQCGDKTRLLDLSDFFLDYKKTALSQGEWIESVLLPKLKETEQLFAYKISKRFEDDISAVALAIKVTMTGGEMKNAVIAFGGLAAIPKLAPEVARVFVKSWQSETLAQLLLPVLAKTFTPLDDMRASQNYRLHMASQLLVKCALQLAGKHGLDLASDTVLSSYSA